MDSTDIHSRCTQLQQGVEGRISEENMTVQEIWQYGKERGPECWAPIISDVDVLDNTNRLITSGIVFGAEPYAKIMEVSYIRIERWSMRSPCILKSAGSRRPAWWAGSELQGRAYPYLSTIKRRPEPPFQVSAISELQFSHQLKWIDPIEVD